MLCSLLHSSSIQLSEWLELINLGDPSCSDNRGSIILHILPHIVFFSFRMKCRNSRVMKTRKMSDYWLIIEL